MHLILTLTICVDCGEVIMIETIFTSNNVTDTGEKWKNLLCFSDEGGETEHQARQHTEKR